MAVVFAGATFALAGTFLGAAVGACCVATICSSCQDTWSSRRSIDDMRDAIVVKPVPKVSSTSSVSCACLTRL